MCKTIFVHAEDDEGNRRDDLPELIFESPDEYTEERPICTCYLGDMDGPGKVLRQTFVEECIRPFLAAVSWGNIVIEVQ